MEGIAVAILHLTMTNIVWTMKVWKIFCPTQQENTFVWKVFPILAKLFFSEETLKLKINSWLTDTRKWFLKSIKKKRRDVFRDYFSVAPLSLFQSKRTIWGNMRSMNWILIHTQWRAVLCLQSGSFSCWRGISLTFCQKRLNHIHGMWNCYHQSV